MLKNNLTFNEAIDFLGMKAGEIQYNGGGWYRYRGYYVSGHPEKLLLERHIKDDCVESWWANSVQKEERKWSVRLFKNKAEQPLTAAMPPQKSDQLLTSTITWKKFDPDKMPEKEITILILCDRWGNNAIGIDHWVPPLGLLINDDDEVYYYCPVQEIEFSDAMAQLLKDIRK